MTVEAIKRAERNMLLAIIFVFASMMLTMVICFYMVSSGVTQNRREINENRRVLIEVCKVTMGSMPQR